MESLLLEEDIIIKCSRQEMIKEFFNDYVIVWHDPNLNSQENQGYMDQLKKFCEILPFTEWQKAKDYIQKTQVTCHVVTSGTHGELLAKEIYEKENVCNLYVFCRNKEYHSSWARKYSKNVQCVETKAVLEKVPCVETEIKAILNQIRKNLLEWYKLKSSRKLNLPAFAPIFNDGDKSQMNHLHRFLKVIPNFFNREQAKNDIVNLSKEIYSDEENRKFIEKFETDYNKYDMKKTLNWYTKDCFLYRVINNSLRIATSDSIQYSRLLLKDIEQAIKDQYQAESKNFNGLLYRGCYLSDKEWSSLKDNRHREIEMHGFLSASKDKEIALRFFNQNSSKMVFITIMVPKGFNEEEQGFAEIEEFSDYKDEKEVLFNVRSRFTVLETEESPYRHLVLLYGAQGFRRYSAENNPLQEVSIPRFQEISCAHCKTQMQNKIAFLTFKERVFYCQKCVKTQNIQGPLLCVSLAQTPKRIQIGGFFLTNATTTPFYGYQCCKCQAKKQKRYCKCLDCNNKFTYCEDCLKDCMQSGHNVILETSPYSFWFEKMSANESSHLKYQTELMEKNQIFQQPEMYFESHEYEKAMQYYRIYLQRYGSRSRESGNIATAYDNIGLIFQKQGEYKKAVDHHKKALEIHIKISGKYHCNVAVAHRNLGSAYHHQVLLEEALSSYFDCLAIYHGTYGDQHPRIATLYGNIANVYNSQGNTMRTYEYQRKALECRKKIYGENHPDVAISYNDIGNIYHRKGDHMKALEYHLKSLEIDKAIYGEDHPNIAASYNNIGSLYDQQKNYQEALEYHSKALNIFKRLERENHPNIATCYHNIGMVKMNQGKYEEAQKDLMKSLEIRKEVFGGNHLYVTNCEADLELIREKLQKKKKTHDSNYNAPLVVETSGLMPMWFDMASEDPIRLLRMQFDQGILQHHATDHHPSDSHHVQDLIGKTADGQGGQTGQFNPRDFFKQFDEMMRLKNMKGISMPEEI